MMWESKCQFNDMVFFFFTFCWCSSPCSTYVAKKLYFILIVSYTNIFHLSLNCKNRFNSISKSQGPSPLSPCVYVLKYLVFYIKKKKVRDQIDIFERLKTKLKYDVKVKDQIYSLPYFLFYFIFSSHNFKTIHT